MHNSKLLTLVQSLQLAEIHWLQKFLKSPFYNSHQLPIILFQYIHLYCHEPTSPKLKKEAAFKKLFPKEDYDVQKMRKTMHELARLIEEFLVVMRLRNQPQEKEKLLLEELGDRNIYDQFEKKTQKRIEVLKALPYPSVEAFKEMYELNLRYYSHIETIKHKQKAPILSATKTYFECFYLLQSQRLYIATTGNKKLFGEEVFVPNALQSQLALRREPAFELFDLLGRAISTDKNEVLYSEIETLFKKEIHRLGRNDQLVIIRLILNYYSSQINRSVGGYHAKMLSLYQFGLKQKLLIEKGLISENIFTNIVTVGLIEQEFDWVKQFINNYTSYLPFSIQKDATTLSKGLLAFYQKDYKNSIEFLLNHTFIKPLYALNAKTILLRTYFEQFEQDDSYYGFLIDQTLAFERYVRRNKSISASKKKPYLNFILFTRRIANALLKGTEIEGIRKQLMENKAVALKGWLLQKF